MSALDGLPLTQFGVVKFPAEKITLHSNGRQYIHEFPHVPGGAPEKLGRGLWYITVRGSFQDRFAAYQDLYPNSLQTLRSYYETQTTNEFTHPTTGKFQAFITSWKQEYEPGKLRSGEKVDIEFLEDQRTLFLIKDPTVSADQTQIAVNQAAMDQHLAELRSPLGLNQTDLSVFDSLRATVNAVVSIQDTAGMYGSLLEAKALELVGLCQSVDNMLSMQNPLCLSILDPLMLVWSGAQAVANQVRSKTGDLAEWTVPVTMSVMDIAIRLYGDASRQSDILTLNGAQIVDPYKVKAGTEIFYFPAS